MDIESIHGYCSKCKNRKICKRPCRFVEKVLTVGNRAVMERYIADAENQIIMNFPDSRRSVRFSETEMNVEEIEYPELPEEPEINQKAKVFYLRFFQKMSYEEISKLVGASPEDCSKKYYDALKRINKILTFMDVKADCEKLLAKDDGLTDEQRIWICKSIMRLTALQISKLFRGKYSPKAIEERARTAKQRYMKNMKANMAACKPSQSTKSEWPM